MSDATYLGNPNLKRANVQQEWTKKQLFEYKRCMEDPLYFIQSYVKIVSLDEGLVPFKMYSFQKEMVGTFHSNRFTICKLPRQSGKSTVMISYLLHYALFNPSVNIAILANKAATARDLLGRLQLAYEDNYQGDFETRRAIIYTLSFTTKFYLYGPVTSSKIIKTVQVDQFANLPEVSPTREQRYSVSPNPGTADADDDFGFNETSSFFEDAKTFDPASGSDVNKTNE